MLSASEANPNFRQFFLENNKPGTFGHVHRLVEDQVKGSPCELHPTAKKCRALMMESKSELTEVDLMCSGSPCDPYSTQRSTRFSTGSVGSHCDYQTTFKHIVAAYMTFNPKVGIVEQVQGFLLPLHTGASITPYDVCHCCI